MRDFQGPTPDELGISEELSLELTKADCREELTKSVELTGTEIFKILTSEKFLRAVEIAGQTTDTTGHESGFQVWIDEQKNIIIPEVLEGNTTSIRDATNSIDWNDDSQGETKRTQIIDGGRPELAVWPAVRTGKLFHFHLHPNPSGPIVPSKPDLGSFREKDIRLSGKVNVQSIKEPLQIIGTVSSGGREIHLLLIKSKGALTSADIEQYDEHEEQVDLSYKTQEEVNSFLLEHRMIAVSLDLKKTENGLVIPKGLRTLQKAMPVTSVLLRRFLEKNDYWLIEKAK